MEQQQPPKRGPGRPPKQGEVKRAFFQTRIRESLKQRLEEDAAKQGRSLSEEIELRLEGSYDRIESHFGGPAGLRLAVTLWANFNFAGGQWAQVQGHPEWTPAEWLADPRCFEKALETLVDSVWAQRPPPVTPEDFFRFCERLYNRRRGRELTQQENARVEAEAAAAKPSDEAGDQAEAGRRDDKSAA
jgi:hypothetical protein